MLTAVGLRDKEVIDIYAQFLRIEAVKGMFGIDDGCYATHFLCFCNGMYCQCCFTRRFGTINFDYTATWITTNAKRRIQTNRTGGNDIYILKIIIAIFLDILVGAYRIVRALNENDTTALIIGIVSCFIFVMPIIDVVLLVMNKNFWYYTSKKA